VAIKRVQQAEVKNMTDNGNGILIDVRPYSDYKKGHIKRAISIPLNEANETENLPQSKNKKIIIYCTKGVKSHIFAVILISMGYTNVCDFGSISNWTYKLEQGA